MVWLTEEQGKTPILVVGAGGVGCELLKNLILSGFTNLTVIDLDTIDVSNLNRQFLFQKKHVGKSKSLVAKESTFKLAHAGREVTIDARHCSIFLPEFSKPWIKQFKMVLNALDNVKARNHVNRLCLAAEIPLIESGTSGYFGEISLIRKGHTPCYECIRKVTEKSFPGCTIRNTPTEPIHCTVWAKFLFGQLFGEPDDEQQVSPDKADPELENSEVEGNVARINTTEWAEKVDWDPVQLFDKFFVKDIQELLKMSKLWERKDRQKPNPQNYKEITGNGDAINTGDIMQLRTSKENVSAWHSAINQIKERRKENGILEWDKDDEDSMMFVAAAANIRAGIFHIEQKTQWKIKEMAGNIIPAIATTNAICAGMIVLQAVKILKNKFNECRDVMIRKQVCNKQLIIPNVFAERNENCVVCADKPTVTLRCNTEKLTLRQFKEKVCQTTLSMLEPDCEAGAVIILSSDEGDTTEDMLNKTLSEYNVVHGSVLVADDFQQSFRVTINVEHVDPLPDQLREIGFEIIGAAEAAKTANKIEEKSRKRILERDNVSDSPAKKLKMIEIQDDDKSYKNSDDDDLIVVYYVPRE